VLASAPSPRRAAGRCGARRPSPQGWTEAKGTSARDFIEARAGGYRFLYRFDRDRIKVALLARMADAHPRETPRLGLADDFD
jgi:hypothetical protein